jgi:phosphate transport system substrate-binding protein
MRFRSILFPLLVVAGSLSAQTAPAQALPVVVCSHDMEPLMLLWMDDLKVARPKLKLDLRANVATEVAKALIEGRSQLVPINRELRPAEVAAFSARWGYAPTRMAIGLDALVILVQKNNPLKSLRIDQLDAMWSTSRLGGASKDIATWGDLGLNGNNWTNRPIVCIDRPEGDGLREFFSQNITRGGIHKPGNHQSTDAMTLVEDLLANQAAISYGSMGEVYNNLRTVAIIPPGGKDPVDPSYESVASGEYPLTRVVYLYFNRAPNQPIEPSILEFLRFVISPQGQKQLAPMGLVPLPSDVLLMNKKRIES